MGLEQVKYPFIAIFCGNNKESRCIYINSVHVINSFKF